MTLDGGCLGHSCRCKSTEHPAQPARTVPFSRTLDSANATGDRDSFYALVAGAPHGGRYIGLLDEIYPAAEIGPRVLPLLWRGELPAKGRYLLGFPWIRSVSALAPTHLT